MQKANPLIHRQRQAPEGEQRRRQGAGSGYNIVEPAVAVGKGEQRDCRQKRAAERDRAV